jgi:hypothetical protein
MPFLLSMFSNSCKKEKKSTEMKESKNSQDGFSRIILWENDKSLKTLTIKMAFKKYTVKIL